MNDLATIRPVDFDSGADYSAVKFDCKTARRKCCYKRKSLKLEDRERIVGWLRLAWVLRDREPG